MYTRESRAAPSLSSFIDTSAGGAGIGRSISEPYQPQSKLKPTTSPLASSSISVNTATKEKRLGKCTNVCGGMQGFIWGGGGGICSPPPALSCDRAIIIEAYNCVLVTIN